MVSNWSFNRSQFYDGGDKSLDRLDVTLFFMFTHLLAEAVPCTEDAPRTPEGGFHAPEALETHRVPQKAFSYTEYRFRTVEAYFEHRVPLKTPSVQKKGVSCTECPFRTGKACFEHRSEQSERSSSSGWLPECSEPWLYIQRGGDYQSFDFLVSLYFA